MTSNSLIFRKAFVLALLFLGCAGLGKSWHIARGGLRFDRCSFQVLPSFEGDDPSPEQLQALSNPFRYLAAGRQCYAFESADGNYILKLPRTDIYRQLPWHRPGDKETRKAYFSQSVKHSLGVLQKETQLEAVRYLAPVILVDRLGRTHSMSQPTWLLQRKTSLLFTQMRKELQAQNPAAARKLVKAFALLLFQLQQKGMVCKDLSFTRNIGYDGNSATFIDMGAFCPREQWPHPMTARIRPWLQTIHPELALVLDQELQNLATHDLQLIGGQR